MRRLVDIALTVACVAGATGLLPAAAMAQFDSTIFRGMTTRNIGPTGMSGRVGAIDAVDANPDVLYVGAATGGLWKSVNGGVTWTPLTDSLPAASIGAIAIYQPNPDIVWIGTGERNRRNSAGVGTGVYRSLDGGKTWTRMGLDSTGAIDAILLDPRDPNVVYVGALGNTWMDSEQRGVYKTTDGGATWRRVLYVNPRTGAGDMVMDPSNPYHLLVGMWEHRRWPWYFKSGGPGSGIYSTYDGGRSWKRLSAHEGLPEGELGRTGFDVARGKPDVVYALVEAKRGVVLRSEDGGDTWSTVNETRNIDGRPFYYGQIRVDPANENHVWIVESPVKVSEDGGKTFKTLLGFDKVHVDHHAFWVSPNGRVLADGNDGGVYLSRDGGETWRFVENLPFAQFYHIAVDLDTPYHIYGGLQDNGSFMGPAVTWHNGGIRSYDWDEVGFGDGMATFPDLKHPRYGYTTTQNGDIVRFDKTTGERKVIKPAPPDTGVQLRFNWNPGLSFDPFDGAVYLGSQFVHKSTDMGNTWTTISPDLTTNDSTKQHYMESGGLTYDASGAEAFTTILQIAPSPIQRGLIWVGTDDGNVQVTRDSGGAWANVTPQIKGGVPPGTWVPHIEPSRFDSAVAFVVFDDHRRGNNRPYLYRTADFGKTWTSLVTADLPYFLHTVVQDPVNPNLLYLGSEFGLYLSFNGGQHWMRWLGVPEVPVRALVVHPREQDLVIGTHGRAAWIVDDVRPLRALASDPGIVRQSLHLFEIPPAIQYRERQVPGSRFTGYAMFLGANRPYGALLTYYLKQGTDSAKMKDGSDSAKVTIQVLAGDSVIRTFKGPAQTGINRMAWDLTRDGFPSPRSEEEEQPPEELPSGPDVVPGTYTVRLTWHDSSVTGSVSVTPDPRVMIADADRQAKLAAIMRAGSGQEKATDAVNRLRSTKKAIDAIKAQLAPKSDDTSKALRAEGDSLKKKLTDVEEAFTGPAEIQGFMDFSSAVLPRFNYVIDALGSSWDTPTDAQLACLRQANEVLQRALERFKQAMTSDVAQYRRRLEAAGVGLLP